MWQEVIVIAKLIGVRAQVVVMVEVKEYLVSCGRGRGRGRGHGRGGGRGRGCGCGRGRGGGRGHHRGGVSSSNGGVNSEENVRVWNTNEENIHVEPYVSSAGPRVFVGDILQLFLQFLTREVITLIVIETNRYARL